MQSVAEWPSGEWLIDPATQVEWPIPEGIAPERVIEHARRANAGELIDIRFYVESSSNCTLWDDIHGPREPSDLGLSAALTAELSAWTEVHSTHCIVFEGWDGAVDVEEWTCEGARLARAVQREIYDFARVLSAYGP